MKPSGSASYLVQYRTGQGQTRRLAFAKVGTLTPDEARTEARPSPRRWRAAATPRPNVTRSARR